MVKLKKPKRWFRAVAPKLFEGKELVQIRGSSPESLLGRRLELSLGELTGDASKQHFKLYFRVKSVEGERALTDYLGHELSWEYISSLARPGTSKIYLNQPLTTKEGNSLRLKLIYFSAQKLDRSQQSAIRTLLKQQLSRRAAQSELEPFLSSILSGELATELQQLIRRIAPVRRLEIYKAEL